LAVSSGIAAAALGVGASRYLAFVTQSMLCNIALEPRR